MTTDDPILTLAEVADMLRTPPSTLRYWRSIDAGPESFKIGSRIVYLTSAVRRYIAKQRAATSVAGPA